MMDTNYFYPNLKKLCQDKKVNIYDVEKYVGVSRGYFSRKKELSVTKLILVAEYLETPIELFLEPPPVQTNADKFCEVFGFMPGYEDLGSGKRYMPSLDDEFWNAEYKPQKDGE